MGLYGSLYVLVRFCGFLLALVVLVESLWILMGAYCLRDLIGPYSSLWIVMGPIWSLSVVLLRYGS